jgi:hypothetical protein
MNLGLEDAWVFAELVGTGRLYAYAQSRRDVDHDVVRKIKMLSRIASAESWFTRFLRSFVLLKALDISFIRKHMSATVTGLDHDLPLDLPGVSS